MSVSIKIIFALVHKKSYYTSSDSRSLVCIILQQLPGYEDAHLIRSVFVSRHFLLKQYCLCSVIHSCELIRMQTDGLSANTCVLVLARMFALYYTYIFWARGYKAVLGAHAQLRAQTQISCSAENAC